MPKLFKYFLDFAVLSMASPKMEAPRKASAGIKYDDVPLSFRRPAGNAYAGYYLASILLQPPIHSHAHESV